MHVYKCVCTYLNVLCIYYMNVCMSVLECVCVCMCVRVCVCVCIYTREYRHPDRFIENLICLLKFACFLLCVCTCVYVRIEC